MFKRDTGQRSLVDINSLIRTVLAILRVDLQKNGIEIETRLDERIPAIEGDMVQLQQVILNGVINGFSRPAGTSAAAALRRLERHRPDILNRVLAGEMSPHGGMVAAGFRRKRVVERRKLTAFDRVMKLLPQLSPIERAMVHSVTTSGYDARSGGPVACRAWLPAQEANK